MRVSIVSSFACAICVLCIAANSHGAFFGPGAHWVDGVVGASFALPNSLIEFGVDTTFDNIAEYNAHFHNGPTYITMTSAMDDSVLYPGLRSVDSHLDVVDHVVTSMNLSGFGASAGWTIRAGTANGVSNPTNGAMAEQSGDNTVATSFFDVFFEIDSTPWGTIHNNTAAHIQGNTTQLPPLDGSEYVCMNAPIGLYDSSNALVANFVNLIDDGISYPGLPHKILPEPGMLGVVALMSGLAFLRRRRHA